jgi:hypothetical protein
MIRYVHTVSSLLRLGERVCSWTAVETHKNAVNNCPTGCDKVQLIIFLLTALHISGRNSTHRQEHI